jgi:hypothetical protein
MTRLRPPALLSAASSTESLTSSPSGHDNSATAARRSVSRTVEGASSNPDRNRLVPKSLLKSISQYLADTPHPISPLASRSFLTTAKEETSHLQNTLARCRKRGGIISE